MNRTLKVIFASLVLFAFIFTPVLAYKLQQGKWASFPRYYYISPLLYVNAINKSATSWNNAGTKAKLSRTTQDGYETILISAADYGGVDWDGHTLYYPSKDAIPRNYVHIRINTNFTENYTSKMRRHLIAHEMGHAIGLEHEGTIDCVLMTPFDFCAVTPKQDDINGVNAKYP